MFIGQLLIAQSQNEFSSKEKPPVTHYRQLFSPILESLVVAGKVETNDKEICKKIVWTLNCLEGLCQGTMNGVFMTDLLANMDSMRVYEVLGTILFSLDDTTVVNRILHILLVIVTQSQKLLLSPRSVSTLLNSLPHLTTPVLATLSRTQPTLPTHATFQTLPTMPTLPTHATLPSQDPSTLYSHYLHPLLTLSTLFLTLQSPPFTLPPLSTLPVLSLWAGMDRGIIKQYCYGLDGVYRLLHWVGGVIGKGGWGGVGKGGKDKDVESEKRKKNYGGVGKDEDFCENFEEGAVGRSGEKVVGEGGKEGEVGGEQNSGIVQFLFSMFAIGLGVNDFVIRECCLEGSFHILVNAAKVQEQITGEGFDELKKAMIMELVDPSQLASRNSCRLFWILLTKGYLKPEEVLRHMEDWLGSSVLAQLVKESYLNSKVSQNQFTEVLQGLKDPKGSLPVTFSPE